MIDISGRHQTEIREIGFVDVSRPLVVNCCGYQKFMTKNMLRHRKNGRLDYQIIYVIKGKLELIKFGVSEFVEEGNIILFEPFLEQRYNLFCKFEPEIYWVHFTGSDAGRVIDEHGIRDGKVGVNGTLIELFKNIISELQKKELFYQTSASALLMRLIVLLGRRLTASGDELPRRRSLDAVVELLHSQYNKNWSIEELSGQCRLSRYHFMRSFREYTGLPPVKFLLDIRMAKAQELLLDLSMNISEIAETLGYAHPHYFSRVFRQYTGVSPSEYRKRNRW